MSFPPQNSVPVRSGTERSRNTLGLIAMIMAIAGFVFACVPGAAIVGWILLPISFILGIVALFRRGETRWQAVTAVILSVVGTIVGVLVFLFVVGQAVDDAVSTAASVSAPSAGIQQESSAAADHPAQTQSAGSSRENPLPIGTEITTDEWKIVINSVALNANDQVASANQFNDPPAVGSQYLMVNYTVTYIGNDPGGSTPFATVNYVSPSGTTIDSTDTFVVAPDEFDSLTTLYNGGSVTGNTVLMVPSDGAENGVLAVTPDLLSDKVFVAVK